MNKSLAITLILVLSASFVMAQKVKPSPKSVLTQVVGTTEVKINYHRPGLKGRTLESLIPNGKVWRTGANQATEITFSKDVIIDGKTVTAGTYSLYSIPGDSEWTVIINSKLSWGTQYSKERDVLRFTGKATSITQSTETFTIDIADIAKDGTNANLELRWGNVVVKAPFEVTL
jgi:DUF2911 family protein